jgi:hypothetical protein
MLDSNFQLIYPDELDSTDHEYDNSDRYKLNYNTASELKLIFDPDPSNDCTIHLADIDGINLIYDRDHPNGIDDAKLRLRGLRRISVQDYFGL